MKKRRNQSDRVYAEEKLNDNHSAVRFVDRYKHELRFVYTWKKWLAWDGKRWCLKHGDNRAGDRGRLFAASLFTDAKVAAESNNPDAEMIGEYAVRANRKERITAIIDLAKWDQRIAIDHERLDDDPYLLNLQNGTLDLRTCELHDHQQSDLLTQVAKVAYDPEADCPLWRQTMDLIFDGDRELIEYVQTLVGYSLAGIIREHIIPICYGEGNNGKSTFWNALHELLGDYSGLVNQDLIMPAKHDAHPTEIADLFGKRFVAVAEPDEDRKLAEAKIKSMAGDSVMKARRMREDYWEFTPTHLFWLSTNHKPKITGTDRGIWRRIKLIPFTVDISTRVKVDKAFPEKLRAEYPGILNWAIEGWKRYQSNGLEDPKAVADATAEYRSAEDEIGLFVRETYIENPSFMVAANDAFEAYQSWGGKANKTKFGREMTKRYSKEKHTAGKYRNKHVYAGLGLVE